MKLGKKRGNSIFYKDKILTEEPPIQEPPVQVNVVEERVEEILTTEKGNIVPIELGVKKNTHSIFFAPVSEGKDFSSVLKEVQEYISENYAQLITDSSLEDAKEQMKRYISKFVMEKRMAVKGMSGSELIDALYTEMAEYGFLTKYIFGKGIEEIDSATRS